MAENQGNPQLDFTSILNSLNNNHGDATERLANAATVIANTLTRNPDAFGLGRRAPVQSQSNYAESKWSTQRTNPRRSSGYRSTGDPLRDFENGIRDGLMSAVLGDDWKKGIRKGLNQFSKEFGVSLDQIINISGKNLTKQALKTFSKGSFGKSISVNANSLIDKFVNDPSTKQGLKNVVSSIVKGSASSGAAGTLGKIVSSGGGAKGAAIAKGGAAAGGPWGLAIMAIAYVLTKVFKPAIEGIADYLSKLGRSWSREEDLRKKRVENAQKRIKADMESIVRMPFDILMEATKKWEAAWDANLRTIGQTQGYDKESVYALYESYAEKLREEGLSSAVSATDIVEKLSSVLSSGLSGKVAEAFAYEATKLGAAIPTQDFFQYASTYASIAANAVSQGQSQAEAIKLANAELEQFASNLLYSSRELAGGFSTGLQNSSELFKNAVQIAQSAKVGSTSNISGTLTSVSAIIGAVAPDLADSLVSNIVQAAIGGNSSQIVALRSLAGINAGNTEFLRAMAENPQQIFSDLFTNLARMQSMSPANYMEVAEGLADVFGIDKAAFARVDFNYLSQAIAAMQVSYDSLDANMDLLASGQTTTSAEQLKAQEINRVILEEGLAYVIDSEAGRAIQQHMWDEQIANELEANTYAVDLQGAGLSVLEGIRQMMYNLLNFLNPMGFFAKGIANMTEVIAQSTENDEDLAKILMMGSVGSNSKSFYNLTTRGQDLGLTTSLVEMLGGTKSKNSTWRTISAAVRDIGNKYEGASKGNFWGILPGLLTGAYGMSGDEFNRILWDPMVGGSAISHTHGNASVSSRYNWGTVGKSLAKAVQSSSANPNSIGAVAIKSSGAATEYARQASNERFKEFLASAEEASKTQSYEDWKKTAKQYGISDLSRALEDYGRTEEELKTFFDQNEVAQGAVVEENRKKDEELFRTENRNFWDYKAGTSGVFQSAMWLPFFGDGAKYDTRMTKIDVALANIQAQIGSAEKHTVISGIEDVLGKLGDAATDGTVIGIAAQIRKDINDTFVSTSSTFQRCLADWVRYMAASADYTKKTSKSSAWSDLQSAEKDQQAQATLALANALGVFSAEELKKMDPQLQTNVLLGEILVVLQAIMQNSNTQAGGLSLMDTLSALGFGVTKQ